MKLRGNGEDLEVELKKKFFKLTDLESLETNGIGTELCTLLGRQFPFMTKVDESAHCLPRLFLKSEIKERVTFYGGAFNPWHRGHTNCLELCPEDHIVVVPDKNPLKPPRKDNCPWKFYKNICNNLKNTSHSIYPGLLGSNSPSSTFEWISHVDVEDIGFVIGDDNFFIFDKWTEYRRLTKTLSRLYVVPRLEDQQKIDKMMDHLLEINSRLEITLLPSHDAQDISSSAIRG